MNLDNVPNLKDKLEAFHKAGQELVREIHNSDLCGIESLGLHERAYVVAATDSVGKVLDR